MSFYRKIPSISYKDHITYKANYWTPWRSPGFRHTTHRWELAGWLTKSKQLKYVGYSWLLFFSHSAKFVAECSVSGLWSSRKMETKMVHGNFSIIELFNNNPEVTVQGGRTKGRQSSKVDRDTSFPICNRIKDMNDTMKLPGQQEQSTIVVMSNKERMKDRFLRNGRTEEWKVNQSLAAETDHIVFVSREILVHVYEQTDLLRILCPSTRC